MHVPGKPEKWLSAHAFPEREADGSTLWHGFLTDVTERKRAEERIYNLAYFDALTGLPNRAQILDVLNDAQLHDSRRGRWSALLFIDLDQFKLLNDTKGHLAGDRLLLEVADRLRSCSDRATLVGRYGGDEFVILLQDLGVDRDAAEVEGPRLRGPGPRTARRAPSISTARCSKPAPASACRSSTAANSRRTTCSSRPTSPCTRPRRPVAGGCASSSPRCRPRSRSAWRSARSSARRS